MNFTREQQQKRFERFLSFLEEHNLSQYQVLSERTGGRSFIVYNSESALAKIEFGLMGGIRLTARNGPLKELLRAWIVQERPSYDDLTSSQDFAGLDSYRYLLHFTQGLPPDGTIQLIPGDQPLVALAERLDYQVYLAFSQTTDTPVPRYHIVSSQGSACDGDDLVDTLARLIKEDLENVSSV